MIAFELIVAPEVALDSTKRGWLLKLLGVNEALLVDVVSIFFREPIDAKLGKWLSKAHWRSYRDAVISNHNLS